MQKLLRTLFLVKMASAISERLSTMTDRDEDALEELKREFYKGSAIIDNNGCHIEENSTDIYPPKRTFYFTNRHSGERLKERLRVHVLFFFLVYGHMEGELSHVCHNSKCFNPSHLERESHQDNCARRTCKDRGICTEHGQKRKCILF